MEFFKRTPSIDFMRMRYVTYGISVIIMVGSIALIAIRGLNFGVDFTGGVIIEVNYPAAADIDGARNALEQAGFEEAQVQSFGSSRDLAVRVPPPRSGDINELSVQVGEALRAADPGVEVRRTEVVGPQVGRDLTEQGGLALLFTFIGILIYVAFRFEKKMASSTVLAAIHDPVAILGFFALTQLPFDLSVLAAVLAVIGYSINDTVVVFDRVRELFLLMRKASPYEVLNAALNQTLSRTVMTSFSVLFVVVSLYAFGGETLKSFSIAIIIGVFVGTYSSVFVSASLVLDMKMKAQDLMPIKKNDPELDALP
ncbi:preprotein translocase subunit SecF [Steroidobacter denitrificans]|uniref:Protein-export membrane protein SecF n=1 Tax=Steroidobacter denitrificans TaxID=465721 RepID=A0A127FAU9_STEDE|nr:protein translocase subunit SecF [Steroidobacter denitrificans]AMN46761.1 preprotein translocase subunit SecF [Steroidobacter denitrificans]